ncbi:M23 family metallopeptidase [Dechloromonas denitrificans]|uniref:M23 family metallopeptidase n=1 Tax=Dechloromonas denitrificans TaxID=281362 RepID=UPI001CF8EAB2|nr:M23 family metallopeptidase [Dechloromonas denitrificans]
MQIILVSRHLKAARTITIMPRHVLMVFAAFFILVLSSSALISWLSVHFRLPIVENLMLSLQQQESRKVHDYLSNNLQLMATRLGELQAKVLQLDSLGERLSGLAGDKPPTPAAKAKDAQGGPFLPAPLSTEALQQEINRLAAVVETKTDELSFLEARLLEKRVKDRLLPTTLPVKDAFFGSPFGYRQDPIAGLRAMHEGIDFIAPPGTPIVAAADGVIVSAEYHPEFGNMVDIDHGAGLTSRYAHMSRLDVETGRMVKGGERIGALGNTGRSTGPHLHFEVRMLGVAQNPALFLKQGQEFAQIKHR